MEKNLKVEKERFKRSKAWKGKGEKKDKLCKGKGEKKLKVERERMKRS